MDNNNILNEQYIAIIKNLYKRKRYDSAIYSYVLKKVINCTIYLVTPASYN